MSDSGHREPCYSERHDGMVLALGRISRRILTVTTRESRQRINQARMEADAARPEREFVAANTLRPPGFPSPSRTFRRDDAVFHVGVSHLFERYSGTSPKSNF